MMLATRMIRTPNKQQINKNKRMNRMIIMALNIKRNEKNGHLSAFSLGKAYLQNIVTSITTLSLLSKTCAHTHTHIHTHTNAHIHTYTLTQISTNTNTHTHTHTHTHKDKTLTFCFFMVSRKDTALSKDPPSLKNTIKHD